MENKFQPIFKPEADCLPLLKEPALFTDMHGVALLWHLPGLITEARHQQLWDAGRTLQPDLQIAKSSKNWRIGPQFFKDPSLCKRRPGTVTLSPAWFQQGHDVSRSFEYISYKLMF